MYESIIKEVEKECRKAKLSGLYIGLRIAERIAGWWTIQGQLVNPPTVEKMTEWTNEALAELKTEIGKHLENK